MLRYRHDYFEDPQLLTSFESYALEIHGLDFSLWKEKGLWDSHYVAFSVFDEDVCIASICVYPSMMLIDGRRTTGAQLLTVGTIPKYRRQNIQRELWKRAEEWIRKRFDFTFLFTDQETGDFYRRLGFDRIIEHSELIEIPPQVTYAPAGARKLDLGREDHYQLVRRLAHGREMVSSRIGFDNPNLLLFMYLYAYRGAIYYLDALDAIVVVSEEEGRLKVHDILAARVPGFAELLPFISHFGHQKIEFLFCTDRLHAPAGELCEIEESLLFAHGAPGLAGRILFPDSIRA